MKALETRNSKLTTRSSRLFAAVCLLTLLGLYPIGAFAQWIAASTPDSPVHNPYTACTGGCLSYPAADMGSPDQYLIPYVNTGSDKLEVLDTVWNTFVTDFDYSGGSWQRTIAHFPTGSSGTHTELKQFSGQYAWDPDAIHHPLNDTLYAVYYVTQSQTSFPGNGLGTSSYHIRLEAFSSTDPPVSQWYKNINYTLDSNAIDYLKNPNIDVSTRGKACMVWEEKHDTNTTNHVYAKSYEFINGLSPNWFDLNPLDFGYQCFYNPDVSCAIKEDGDDQNDPYYITFMGIHIETKKLHLLSYTATASEVWSGSTPILSRLKVVDNNMPQDANLTLGNYISDYLYRPRIAAHPNFTLLSNDTNYNIVVPYLASSYGTQIHTYTFDGGSGSFLTYDMTNTPSSGTSVDCALNFEPCTAVNEDGYDVVWTIDQLQLFPGYLGSTGAYYNPLCQPLSGTESIVLRKSIDWLGVTAYQDYSFIPDNIHQCCYTHAPCVAYDETRFQGGYLNNDVFYGFHYGNPSYDFESFYKLSDYTNSSMKRDLSNNTSSSFLSDYELTYQGDNLWKIHMENEIFTKFTLFDPQGKVINSTYRFKSMGESFYSINLNQLAAGIYFIQPDSPNSSTFKLPVY